MRTTLRRQRKSIPPTIQKRAAQRLAQLAFRCAALRHARRVAVYLSMGSELATQPLIAALRSRRIAVFAPAMLHGQMGFRALGHAGLQVHRLGMLQPRCGAALRASAMDVVILPLLGFDARGTRLGQGGGHYDRALSKAAFRPYRLGLAYAVQQINTLPREPWDVPLHAVLTERGLRRFAR
ncbi:MAG: 5-formyltetrahydrofolate cyclo-ligase [Pseudomonadota bacterium]